MQLLLCSIVMQNIQIYYEVPVMLVVTCYIYYQLITEAKSIF